MKFYEFLLSKYKLCKVFAVLVGLVLTSSSILMHTSHAAPLSQQPPTPCEEVAFLEQYLLTHIPPDIWQDELFVRGANYTLDEKYQTAIVAFQEALDATPNSTYADFIQMTIGETYADMQDYGQSLVTYETFLDNYPTSIWRDFVYYHIAVAHYKQGNSTQAKAALQALIDEYPESIFIAYAHQNIQSIVAKEPPIFLTDLYQQCADSVESETKLYEQVATEFTSILEELKTLASKKQLTLADLYGELGDETFSPSSAFRIAEKYLEQYPNSERADSVYYIMVVTHLTLGNYVEAVDVYQRMEVTYPNNPYLITLQPLIDEINSLTMVENVDVLFERVQAQFEAGQYTEVIVLSQQLLDILPESERASQVQLLLANAYVAQELYSEALATYLAFVKQYPDNAAGEWAHYQIAACYAALSDWHQAETTLQSFLVTYPNSVYKDDAQSKLQEIEIQLSSVEIQDCDALKAEGNELSTQGHDLAALEKQQLALACYEATDNPEGVARAKVNIGNLYSYLNNPEVGQTYLLEALALTRELDVVEIEAAALAILGRVRSELADYDQALIDLFAAEELWRELGQDTSLITAYAWIGLVYEKLADYEQSQKYYQQALDLRPASEFQRAVLLGSMGMAYSKTGTYKQAVETLEQALDSYRKNGYNLEAATTLDTLASFEMLPLQNYSKAVAYYGEAYQIYLGLGEQVRACQSLAGQGQGFYEMADYGQALRIFQEARDLCRSSGAQEQQAFVLQILGQLYSGGLDNADLALHYLEQALSLWQELKDFEAIAEVLGDIADIYSLSGQSNKALKYYTQALALWQQMDNSPEIANTYTAIARVYRDLYDYDTAEQAYLEALAIYDKLQASYSAVDAVLQLASFYAFTGDIALAHKRLDQVFPLDESLSGYNSVFLGRVALVYAMLGDYHKEIEYRKQLLDYYQETGDVIGEANTWTNLGRAYENLNELVQAKDAYLQAIELWEEVRSSASVDDIKTMLANRSIETYERAILVLIQLGEPHQAFNIVERARARSLLDQTGRIESPDKPELMELERILRQDIHQLEAELQEVKVESTNTKVRLGEVKNKIDDVNATIELSGTSPILLQEHEALVTEMVELGATLALTYSVDRKETQLQNSYSEYEIVLTQIKLATLSSEVQQVAVSSWLTVQQTLAPDETLLEYYVAPTQTLAFVITRDQFHTVSIPVMASVLGSEVKALREQFKDEELLPAKSQELYNLILQPVQQYINTPKLYIVPHSVLHYLPFAALHDGESYLIEEYILVNLPSASVLALIDKRLTNSTPQDSMLALCKSEAEGTTEFGVISACPQAQKVAELFGAQAFEEAAATETLLKQQSPFSNWIHIAAHGKFIADRPLLSRIYLAGDDENDGLLETSEIFNLRLHADTQLVTLSGCETSMPTETDLEAGVVSPGDEIVGLNRAFISAGAPTVLATLWKVGDAPTTELMTKFYTYLDNGYSKGTALHCAQKDMLQEKGPHYWAGFVLTGDMGLGLDDVSCAEEPHTSSVLVWLLVGIGGLALTGFTVWLWKRSK